MQRILMAFLFLSATAYAGDNGGGTIECKSGTGRTEVKGMAGVEYNGVGPASVNYSIDGKAVALGGATGTAQWITSDAAVFSKDQGIYTLKFSMIDKAAEMPWSQSVFTMTSVPSTFKMVSQDLFAFTAIVQAGSIDPRGNSFESGKASYFDKPIALSCRLDLRL